MLATIFDSRDLFYLKSFVALDELKLGQSNFEHIIEIAWFVELAWYCSRKKFKEPPKHLRQCRENIFSLPEEYAKGNFCIEIDFYENLRKGIVCASGVFDKFSRNEIINSANEMRGNLKESYSLGKNHEIFYLMKSSA